MMKKALFISACAILGFIGAIKFSYYLGQQSAPTIILHVSDDESKEKTE